MFYGIMSQSMDRFEQWLRLNMDKKGWSQAALARRRVGASECGRSEYGNLRSVGASVPLVRQVPPSDSLYWQANAKRIMEVFARQGKDKE